MLIDFREFKFFCYEMFLQNAEERDTYNQRKVTYEEYFSKNEKFLLDKYREVCNNKA